MHLNSHLKKLTISASTFHDIRSHTSSQHHVGSISFSLGLSCWPSNLSCELETDNWNLFALKLSRIEKGGRNIGKRTQTYSSFFLWFDFIWNWDRSLNLISSFQPHDYFISFIEDHSRRKEGAEWFQRLILTGRYQNNSTHHTSWLQTTSRWRGENFIFCYFTTATTLGLTRV